MEIPTKKKGKKADGVLGKTRSLTYPSRKQKRPQEEDEKSRKKL